MQKFILKKMLEKKMYLKNRVGEEYYNKAGYRMIITKYNSAKDIEVTFDNGYCVNTTFNMIKNGWVKNRTATSVLQHGIIGNCKISCNGKAIKEYRAWQGMLVRCFSDKYKFKKPTYKDVTCCEDWLIFENFLDWVKEQENYPYYQNNDVNWQLDKDILVKGNKIYSPETCLIVPSKVNSLFIKSDNARGNYPIGVGKEKQYNSFYYRCNMNNGNRVKKCGFNNAEDAFQEYKKCKESVIREIAKSEFTKGAISKKCFEAMINYKVEITD